MLLWADMLSAELIAPKASVYQKPQWSTYIVDFGKIYRDEAKGQQITNILASLILAKNLKHDLDVQPHLLRESPMGYQQEVLLA
jgi:hypothetical protein